MLAIEDVANDEDKAFLMGTLIIRIVEHLRLRAADSEPSAAGLRHVIVIEEAHRLLRDRGDERASAHAVELFAGMLAEIRAYGEGIVVAEQIPTKLVPDVVKNTALKVVHRLPAEDDRRLVGAAMNLDEDQSRAGRVAAAGRRRRCSPTAWTARCASGAAGRGPRATTCPARCRRSAAAVRPPAARECRHGRACTLVELREADLLAVAPEWAWLRIWADTLVLAYLHEPAAAGRAARAAPTCGPSCPPRRRECLLATLAERSCGRRAWSLRTAYDPAELTEKVAEVAARLLGGPARTGAASGPGAAWVIPQVRWLHEMDRLFPYGQPAPNRAARPRRWSTRCSRPAERRRARGGSAELLGHRAKALRHHPLSMEVDRNRALAWRVDPRRRRARGRPARPDDGRDRRRSARTGQVRGPDDERGVAGDRAVLAAPVRPAVRRRRSRGAAFAEQ